MAADDRRLFAALEGEIGDVLDRDAPLDWPFRHAEPATQGQGGASSAPRPGEAQHRFVKAKATENNL